MNFFTADRVTLAREFLRDGQSIISALHSWIQWAESAERHTDTLRFIREGTDALCAIDDAISIAADAGCKVARRYQSDVSADRVEAIRNGIEFFVLGDTDAMNAWKFRMQRYIEFARDFINVMELSSQGGSQWTQEEESEARRVIANKKVTTASGLREMFSMRQANAQALFRHITGKSKKKHRTD